MKGKKNRQSYADQNTLTVMLPRMPNSRISIAALNARRSILIDRHTQCIRIVWSISTLIWPRSVGSDKNLVQLQHSQITLCYANVW